MRNVKRWKSAISIDRRRVLEICRSLGGLNPAVAWSCDANVMTVDREMLAAMKSAGCWSISYGLESGSQNVLRSLNKRITLDNARQAVHLTREAGIYAKGLFILGTPQESLDTIRDTQQFISSIPLSTINISKFTPYPGTELYREVSSGLDAEYEQLNGMNFLVPSKYLTVAQLEEQYGIMLRKFYHRIGAWTSHLPIIFGCWDNVRRLASIVPMAARAKIRRWTGTAPC